MTLFRGIQEYIVLDANNITLAFDSGNIVNISGNIFLYSPQGHPKYIIIPSGVFCELNITRRWSFYACAHSARAVPKHKKWQLSVIHDRAFFLLSKMTHKVLYE